MKTSNPELHEKRRLEIIDASAHCFVKQGFHQTGMRDISQQAGVSLGTLYRYFSNKEAIILAITELEHQGLQVFLEALAEGENIIESIIQVIPWALAESNQLDQISLGMEVMAEAARNETVADNFRQQDQQAREVITGLLRKGMERGIVDNALSAEQVTELLIALYDGLEGRVFCNPDFDLDELRATFAVMMRRFLKSPSPRDKG